MAATESGQCNSAWVYARAATYGDHEYIGDAKNLNTRIGLAWPAPAAIKQSRLGCSAANRKRTMYLLFEPVYRLVIALVSGFMSV